MYKYIPNFFIQWGDEMKLVKLAKISVHNKEIINSETNLLIKELKRIYKFDGRIVGASIRKLHKYLITVMKDMKKNRDTDIDADLYNAIKQETRYLCSLIDSSLEVISSLYTSDWCEIKIGIYGTDRVYKICGNYYI